MSGTLFVVATPIGNLEDLTPRARQTLASVSLVAAEDTRHTGRLLMHIGAKPRQIALHDHNESAALLQVIETLKSGDDVALVSDAGTPLISDPGYRLVRAAHENSITVVPIPGASAVTAALSVAGLATDRFAFEGFVPSGKAARRQWLQDRADERRTLVMYESVHRIRDSMADMVDAFGAERPAFLGRELTKLHEQCVRHSFGELQQLLDDATIPAKGEFVVIVEGADEDPAAMYDTDLMLLELDAVLPAKQAAGIAAKLSGQKKNALYRRLLSLRGDNQSGVS